MMVQGAKCQLEVSYDFALTIERYYSPTSCVANENLHTTIIIAT